MEMKGRQGLEKKVQGIEMLAWSGGGRLILLWIMQGETLAIYHACPQGSSKITSHLVEQFINNKAERRETGLPHGDAARWLTGVPVRSVEIPS